MGAAWPISFSTGWSRGWPVLRLTPAFSYRAMSICYNRYHHFLNPLSDHEKRRRSLRRFCSPEILTNATPFIIICLW